MEDFSNLMGKQPYWLQPKTGGRTYELRDDNHLYGSLVFRSSFGSLATADFSGGRYTFKRVGFFNPQVTVRREGEEIDLAVYRPNWTGAQGLLEIDGKTLGWRPANFWATRYAWYQGKDMLLVYQQGGEQKRFSDLFKTQSQVTFFDLAWRLGSLPILTLLGWYLVILYEQDSAAVVAATAATS